MDLALLAGSAGRHLIGGVAAELGVEATTCTTERFPDGEAHVLVGDVGDRDAYVLQATGPPVDEHLVELLLLLDTCRRSGAARVTAVLPYLGYGRHDRRSRPGEALALRMIGELLRTCGADRVVLLDPHSASAEGNFAGAVEVLSVWPLLTDALRPIVTSEAVVLAPDEGAVKLADRVAGMLELPLAFVRKRRISGGDVSVAGIVGQVRGRPLLVVDDMISTGATIRRAVEAALDAGALPDTVIAVCHGVFVGHVRDNLGSLPLQQLLVSDSLPPSGSCPSSTTVVGVTSLLSQAIDALHGRRPGS
jgi:ribose-phosphate pyrophosphokinase